MKDASTRCRGAALAVLTLLSLSLSARADENVPRHALLIGVDYGTSQHLSFLRHPAVEINTLADILPLVGYPEKNVAVLLPGSVRTGAKTPTVAAMREALGTLTRGRGKDDVVLLAFSGHLIQWRNGDCYLCGSDSKANDKSTLLPLSEVYAALKNCQAGTRIVLLDGCRKSSATQGSDVLQKVPYPHDITPPRGVTVLFAASAGEVSSERSDHAQGYFFQSVIEALLGAQGLDQNGRVSVQDLERYVCRRVVNLSASESSKQTPEFTGSRRGDVAKVPLETRSGLGAMFGPVDYRTKQEWNVPYGRPQVRFTVSGSSARRAGILPGTVVLEIDGTDVPNVAELVKVLAQKKIGDEIRLSVVSEGQRQMRTVKLVRLPSSAVWAAQVRQMAAEGNLEATYQVGQELFDGTAVKRDYPEAIKWFTRAANKGHGGAQAQLGYMYYYGLGVPQNSTAARDFLEKAVAQDNPDACVTLASLYYYGNGVVQSDSDAYRYYRKAADQMNRDGQYNVGLLLLAGRGVNKDGLGAVTWLTKAAEQGHTMSQVKLGELYQRGEEITQDTTKSNQWFARGMQGLRAEADRGDSESMTDLGTMYLYAQGVKRDDAEALKWYRKAADAGNKRGWHNVGMCYYYAYSVTKNYGEAERWFRKAAEAGLPISQYYLGILYHDGTGVTKDVFEAARWYRKAADQGYGSAQVDLGLMYSKGEGVTKDEREAVRLYKLAVAQGQSAAMNNLGWMYAQGLGGLTKNDKEAYRLYLQAAEKGLAMGMYNVAGCYADGSGTNKNVTEAIRWYKKSIDLGEPRAMNDLGVMYDTGKDVTQDLTEAMRLYKLAAEKNYALAVRNVGNMYHHGRGVTVDKTEAIRWYRKAANLGDAEAQKRLNQLQGDVSSPAAPSLFGD